MTTHVWFITTTSKARHTLLLSTLLSVMQGVATSKMGCLAHFLVNTYDPLAEQIEGYLRSAAECYGVELHINLLASDVSVAWSKHAYPLPKDKTDFVVNLDDDLMIDNATVRLYLAQAARQRTLKQNFVLTTGVVDMTGARGHADYDRTRYESIEEAEAAHGLSKVKHHFINSLEHLFPYSWLSQLYMLPAYIYFDEDLWGSIRERFSVKGVRGYDIALEQELVKRNLPIMYFSGFEAIHTGMEAGFLNSRWTSTDKVVDTVVTLNTHE